MTPSRHKFYLGLVFGSLCVGLAVFFLSSYKSSTLVIDTRTMEMGKRRIVAEAADSGKRYVLWFETGNSAGEKSFYPVELPAIQPKTITIEPLAGRGKFEIDRIMMYNENITYTWDARGGCERKFIIGGTMRKDVCDNTGPLLVAKDDLSITISSIPTLGFANTLTYRVAAALGAFVGAYLLGAWFFRRVPEGEVRNRLLTCAARVAQLTLAVCCLIQFYLICQNAVDVPFWEEWEYFKLDALQHNFSLSWIYRFALDHRIVPTKVMAWINFKLFGLDFARQKIFNYLIFLGLIAAVVKLKNMVVGSTAFVLFPAFLVFMTSSIAYENHLFSYQSQIHFVLLFAVAALYFAYEDGVTMRSTIVFPLILLASITTFSAGVVFSCVYLMFRTMYIAMLRIQQRITSKQGLLSLAANFGIVGVGILSWFCGYEANPLSTPRVSIFSRQFWECFLDLVSFGFGFEVDSVLPGVLCLFVVIGPVFLLMSRKRTIVSPESWRVATGIMGIVAVLASIAMTRGGLAGAGKTSRYAEFGFMLIPLAALAWWLVLRPGMQRITVLLALWLLLFISYFDNWSANPYRVSKQLDLVLIENLELQEKAGGDFLLPETYPFTIKDYFERARKLNVHFTRQLAVPFGAR